ncbi:hypothetical protein Ciccas_009045 [Cichlidogyrus casuarinus]|uniref:MULE transposase domain-containing protein n=1 Tax=Cichlidogyrus casuarinus TaxID=1844966 RepID=A0ABD2PYD9_9PLAT
MHTSIAITQAFQACLPNASVRYCWFHYCQNLKRKMEKLGSGRSFPQLRQFVGHFIDLPFLPTRFVPDYVRILGQKAGDDASSNLFLEFFQQNYVFAGCRFPISSWSLHNRHEEDIPTTNNFLEANNAVINHQIGYHRHHFIRTMQVLQRDHSRSVVTKMKMDLDDSDYPLRNPKAYGCFLANMRTIRRNYAGTIENPAVTFEPPFPKSSAILKI